MFKFNSENISLTGPIRFHPSISKVVGLTRRSMTVSNMAVCDSRFRRIPRGLTLPQKATSIRWKEYSSDESTIFLIISSHFFLRFLRFFINTFMTPPVLWICRTNSIKVCRNAVSIEYEWHNSVSLWSWTEVFSGVDVPIRNVARKSTTWVFRSKDTWVLSSTRNGEFGGANWTKSEPIWLPVTEFNKLRTLFNLVRFLGSI